MIAGEITVGGARLEFARWGSESKDKTPILLIHEGLGSIALWRDFPGQLAKATGRQAIAWSRQGHGNSERVTDVHEPDYMHREAELLPEVHAALGLDHAYWLGHSDGGSIALIGAALYPHLVAGLVLEAPHVFVEDKTVSGIAEITATFAGSDMVERMGRYHAEPDPLFRRWSNIWLDPVFREWNIEDLLPSIQATVLNIQGLEDEYGTLMQLDRIEVGVPHASRLTLTDCRHSPHRDRTDAVLEGVRAFVYQAE